jgi:predicted glycosyltransferase/peptidoglycan/xylan/chitin deacetylase (PgdA/CDA1 family)
MFKKSDYYFLKSVIPRRLQIAIRQELIRRKLPLVKDVWPIDEAAGKPPDGWKGWPDGKKFALVLTHDVETEKGVKNCRLLMDTEERFGFRSSFGFVAKDYDVPQQLLKDIEHRGFELCVHGLYHDKNPFRSKEDFYRQASEINRYIAEWGAVGFRSPSMYHDLELVRDLNIDYDASTFDTDPFEPQPDGVGTIFPFWVGGNAHQKGYVELPYTLPQDFLLFILMREQNIDIWKKKLDWIAKHGGMALVITHSDYMNFENKDSSYKEFPVRYYEDFLEYIKSRYKDQYWHVLPKKMARFWASNYGDENKKIRVSIPEKKKIWIDLDNSPHVPFFKPILDDLNKHGHSTLLTARDCFQVCGLADLMKLEYTKIGRHYGKNKLMKVAGLLIRSMQLMSTVLNEKPDIAVSHGSRSQVLIASMLNIPTVVIADYEYTQTVAKPTYIIVPEMISDNAVKGYTKAVLKYPGIKEDVYVPDFKPDASIYRELGISEGELIVTIRPPATEAHYHNPESELLFEATLDFLGQQKNTRMVILPRNEKKQTAWVKSNWSDMCNSRKIIFPEHVVDGLNLIWHSDLVISGGGTMNREAAALGVPVYSIFRGKIGAVDRYLSENGRLVLLESVEDVRTKILLVKRLQSNSLENTNHEALNKIIEHIERILKEGR